MQPFATSRNLVWQAGHSALVLWQHSQSNRRPVDKHSSHKSEACLFTTHTHTHTDAHTHTHTHVLPPLQMGVMGAPVHFLHAAEVGAEWWSHLLREASRCTALRCPWTSPPGEENQSRALAKLGKQMWSGGQHVTFFNMYLRVWKVASVQDLCVWVCLHFKCKT